MARKKVKLAWIPNDSARRATFRKRRKGLMKKLEELSVLCNVEACGIVYGPDEPQPEVWPSKGGARRVLERFKSMPVMEQSKKMMDQEGFTRHQVMKLQDQLRKHERDNLELETAIVMHKCLCGDQQAGLDYMNMDELTSLAIMVEAKLKAVHDRIELISVTTHIINDASHDQTEQYHLNIMDANYSTAGAIVVHGAHDQEENNNNNNNNHHNHWELAVAMDAMQKHQAWPYSTTTTSDHVMNPIPINDPAVYYGSGDQEVMQQPPYNPYNVGMTMTNHLNILDPPCWI